MNTFGERLFKLRKEKKLARDALGDKIGVSKTSIKNWEDGENTPKLEYIQALSDFFKVSFNWLANGEGSMDAHESVAVTNHEEPDRDVIQRFITSSADSSSLISIPYFDARVACGPGVLNADNPDVIGRYEISEDFLLRLGLPVDGKGLILINSDGDSMHPSIPSDTPLLVNTLEKDFQKLVNGKVYIFCANGASICKRIYKNIDGTVKLHSDNTNKDLYPDQNIDRDQFESFAIIGRVKFAFVEF